jgi:hypothetical protein
MEAIQRFREACAFRGDMEEQQMIFKSFFTPISDVKASEANIISGGAAMSAIRQE